MRVSYSSLESCGTSDSRHRQPVHSLALRLTIFLVVAPVFAAVSSAQKLSLPHFDVSDGLVSSNIHSIYQDRRGFLWFGTNDGLSRFDGYRFVNYGKRDGLANTDINCVVEDPQGRIWVATNGGGIARLLNEHEKKPIANAKEKPVGASAKFISLRAGSSQSSNRVNKLLFDSRGSVWCLTDAGVFRANTSVNELSFELFIADNAESQDAFE